IAGESFEFCDAHNRIGPHWDFRCPVTVRSTCIHHEINGAAIRDVAEFKQVPRLLFFQITPRGEGRLFTLGGRTTHRTQAAGVDAHRTAQLEYRNARKERALLEQW